MSEQPHPFLRFSNFAQAIWRHLALPPLTPVQKEICDWMQYGDKRNQTWGFRGVGKSYICSAYVIWLLYLNPDEKILVVSASKDRADAFVQFTRRLIGEIDYLAHLVPNRLRGDRDSTVSFDVGAGTPAHSPSVKAMGITGQLSGSRASCIVLDDVEVPANSATPAQREKLSEAIKEVDAILLPANEDLRIDPKVRVLGTPQSMQTVYAELEERGYVPRIWPIVVPETDTIAGYRGHLAPRVQRMIEEGEAAGTPVEPTRFEREDIAERRLSYGALGFALQFMLSTALADAEKYPLKTYDIIFADFPKDKAREVYIHSRHPQNRLKEHANVGMQGDGFFHAADQVGDYLPFDSTVVVVDPSGRGKDETAILSGSRLAGQIFVHRVFGTTDGYSESTLEAIALEARRVKANRIIIEANYGDGMFSQLLRPVLTRIYPCTIEEVKHSTNKELRIIDTLSPVLESHRIVMNSSIIEQDKVAHTGDSDRRARERQLFYQLTHLTHDRGCLAHDDRLDGLSMLVAHFAPDINVDAKTEQREREQAEFWALADRGVFPEEGNSWLDSQSTGSPSLFNPF